MQAVQVHPGRVVAFAAAAGATVAGVAGFTIAREPPAVATREASATQVAAVAAAVDVLQTPAFLCRQTDFIHAVAASGKPVNIKKGQFLAPGDMKHVVDKAREAAGGADSIMVCERGVSFGYNNLVSDMRSLAIMRESGCPVVFDATHSVQLPGGQGSSSGGQREFVPVLARAAVATGIAGLFMETHPDPAKALSDGPNAWPLPKMKQLLRTLKALDQLVKQLRGNLGQRRRPRGYGCILQLRLARHTCSLLTCYASHTKFRTGSAAKQLSTHTKSAAGISRSTRQIPTSS